jgi:hypothetical protein
MESPQTGANPLQHTGTEHGCSKLRIKQAEFDGRRERILTKVSRDGGGGGGGGGGGVGGGGLGARGRRRRRSLGYINA